MDVEALVADARQRRPQPMSPRERLYAGLSAVAFLGAVGLLGAVLPHDVPENPALLILPVLLYALGTRCQFELANGFAMPLQIAFIPMLFVAPLPLVPLLVALGYLLGRLPDFILKRSHWDRWLHCFGQAWYAVGPVALIGFFAPGPPNIDHAGVYGLALLAACAVGVTEAIVGDHVLHGTHPRETFEAATWSYWIDAL